MAWEWKDGGGGGDFEPAPAGNTIGICTTLIDLGTHYNEMYDNYRHQCYVGFELPNEIRTYKDRDTGEEVSKPYTVGKFYTTSLSEKANLRKDLESWRGRPFTEEELKGFDPKNILTRPCLLNIIHKTKNDKPKAAIASVSPIVKGMAIPKMVSDVVYYSIEDHTEESFDKVPAGFQDMIRRSEEWKEMQNAGPRSEPDEPPPFIDDDIPF